MMPGTPERRSHDYVRHGTTSLFTSVKQLEADIRDWIAQWNENPRPYVWVKTAEKILASLARYCARVSAAAAGK